MAIRRETGQRKDDKGWLGLLGLLGLLGGLAWAAFGKKAEELPPAAQLAAVSVEFRSPGEFYPGSRHEAVVTIRNSGNAAAEGILSLITLIYSFSGSEPPFGAGLPATIPAGATVVGQKAFFTIPAGALPGEGVSFQLAVQYDGYTLNAQGPAFTVEAPLLPILELVSVPTFT